MKPLTAPEWDRLHVLAEIYNDPRVYMTHLETEEYVLLLARSEQAGHLIK